jgi:hypothetical protein
MSHRDKEYSGNPDTPTLEAEAILAQAKFEAHKASRYGKDREDKTKKPYFWKVIGALGAIGLGTIFAIIAWGVDIARTPEQLRQTNGRVDATNAKLDGEISTRQMHDANVMDRLTNIETQQKDTLQTLEQMKASLYRIEGKLGGMSPRQKDDQKQ